MLRTLIASSDVMVLPLASVIVKSSWDETGARTTSKSHDERQHDQHDKETVEPSGMERVNDALLH